MPTPGGDSNKWGSLLNEFLSVAHDSQGNLKQSSLITGAQQKSQKGQANGYASLGSNSKIPIAQLPGIGDYFGVYADNSTTVPSDNYTSIAWDDTTTFSGSSLALDTDDDPTQVRILETGVYSITVTVHWQDIGPDAGARLVQIFTRCDFLITDQRVGFGDSTNETIQTVTATLYLQPGDDIQVSMNQTSGGDLTPYCTMLITRCA